MGWDGHALKQCFIKLICTVITHLTSDGNLAREMTEFADQRIFSAFWLQFSS